MYVFTRITVTVQLVLKQEEYLKYPVHRTVNTTQGKINGTDISPSNNKITSK